MLCCEFKCYISFEVSIPAPHTHMHAINEQFKCHQSTTLQLFKIRLHQGTAVLEITATAPPSTYLQFFVSSLGKFSSQSVQSLFDGAVHRQHMGQLTQRGIQLIHTRDREDKRLKSLSRGKVVNKQTHRML